MTSKKNGLRERLNFDPASPPYNIGNRRGPRDDDAAPLDTKTFDMNAKHHSGTVAYDMHNLYGECFMHLFLILFNM